MRNENKIAFTLIAIALLATPAYALTNISILYAYNGTNFVQVLANNSGKLLTDINFSNTALDPKANNSRSLGSAPLQWVNTFSGSIRSAGDLSLSSGGTEKVTIKAGGNVGIGNVDPQQKLVVAGQANITGTAVINGTIIIRGATYNWPSADGGANSLLTTNAAGGLSWSGSAGGGSSNISSRNVTAGSFGADTGGGFYSFPENLSVATNLSVSGRVTDKTGFLMPIGTVAPYSGAVAPPGWLVANGSEVNRTTYPDLFNITGTIYGNTSDSTFKLPDLRQRFALGKADTGTGSTLGGTGGGIDHTHTGPSHTHGYSTVIAHTHAVDPPSTASDSTGSHSHSFDPPSIASGGGSSHTHSVDPGLTSVASGGSHSHTINVGGDAGGGGSEMINGPNCCDTRAEASGSASHSHTLDVASFSSAAETAHTHSTDIASTASGSGGGHTHSTDIASFTSGSTGSASGTMDAGGTGASGTGNPPFIALIYIVKY